MTEVSPIKLFRTFLCLLLAALFSVSSVAAEGADPARPVTLTVLYQDGETPLSGAEFALYQVAAADENGALTLTKDFSAYPVDLAAGREDAFRSLSATLEGFVLRDDLTPLDRGTTDAEGRLTFPVDDQALPHGLYLVIGSSHEQNDVLYTTDAFMVQLPAADGNGGWIYDAILKPKYHATPVEDDKEDDTIRRKVLKVWKDDGTQRPAEVIIQLLRDGEVYDTVTLSAKNTWRHTWNKLDADHRWTVVEQEVEGYTVEVTREGITFVVTNTAQPDTPDSPDDPGTPDKPDTPDDPDPPDFPPVTPEDPEPGSPSDPDPSMPPVMPEEPLPGLPQTGQLWWPVPLLPAGGLLLIILGLLRRKGAYYGD